MYKIEDEYPLTESGKYLFIVPVSRLTLKNKVRVNEITIYPKNTLNIDKLYENNFSFDEEQNQLRKTLSSYTLFVFFITDNELREEYNLSSKGYDNKIVEKAISTIEPLLDIIRYYYCEYNYPFSLPSKAGQLDDGRCVSIIKGNILENKISISNKYSSKLVLGSGLTIKEEELLASCTLHNDDVGETGNIIKHSLALNSSILEQDNLTAKFMQIMTLFEYLAFPYEYKPFKEVKKKISSHIACNKVEYERLLDVFYKYTSKQGYAYRTEIIHNGKTIEELIPNEIELLELFSELHHYICLVISDLLKYYNKDWGFIKNLRKEYVSSIESNILIGGRTANKILTSRNIAYIDVRYLWIKLKHAIEFHPENSGFSLENLLYYFVAALRVDKYKKGTQVHIIIPQRINTIGNEFIDELFKYNNTSITVKSYTFNISILKAKGSQKFSDVVYRLSEKACSDGNRFFEKNTGFKNILIFSDNIHCNKVAKRLIDNNLNVDIRFSRNFNSETKIDGEYLYVVSNYVVAQSIGVSNENL